MSKYHNLPDIVSSDSFVVDTAADVFETVDEPESSLRPSHEGNNDDDSAPTSAKSDLIDQSALPARRGVEKAFGRSRRKDGSYQLGLPPLSRSSSSSSSEGISNSKPREAPAARLRRLKAELEEVEKELSQSSAPVVPAGTEENAASSSRLPAKRKSVLPPRKGVDLVGEISGLRKRLEVLDQEDGVHGVQSVEGGGGAEERLRKLALGNGDENGDVPAETPEEAVGADGQEGELRGASVLDLDRRLATLEEILGSTGEGLDQTPTSPLLPSLSKLDHLLSLLSQPRNLDVISRRLKLLLVDLDRAAASSRRNPSAQAPHPSSTPSNLTISAAEYAQLQTLFALLPRLDPLLPILPPLMARLRSLAGLHAEAGRVVEGLKKLEGEGTRRGEEVKELKAVVEAVKQGVEEGGKRALGNWEAVERRMKDLEGRIARLGEQ